MVQGQHRHQSSTTDHEDYECDNIEVVVYNQGAPSVLMLVVLLTNVFERISVRKN